MVNKRTVKMVVSTVLLWAAATATERWTADTSAAQAAVAAGAHGGAEVPSRLVHE